MGGSHRPIVGFLNLLRSASGAEECSQLAAEFLHQLQHTLANLEQFLRPLMTSASDNIAALPMPFRLGFRRVGRAHL